MDLIGTFIQVVRKGVIMRYLKTLSISVMTMALVLLAGCSKLSIENYNKLKVGMDKEEVEAIIGGADRCDEALGAESCVWGNEEKNIKVKLVAGKAVFFSKNGLQ